MSWWQPLLLTWGILLFGFVLGWVVRARLDYSRDLEREERGRRGS